MASPEPSRGVGPPDPMDTAALQPKPTPCAEREGAVAVAPAAHVAAAACGLRCKAFLVLGICLSAVALPYGLWALAALPGSLARSHAWPDSPGSQREMSGDLMATHEDLLKEPSMQLHGRVLMGSVGTPGVKGDVTPGVDAEGWSQGTQSAQTSLLGQPGRRDKEGPALGTAVAVTPSPVRRFGTGVPDTSAQLLQPMDGPSPGSWHGPAAGSPRGTEPGSHNAVTSAHGLGQAVGTAEPWHPERSSEDSAGSVWMVTGIPSQSHSLIEEHSGDWTPALGASPDPWTVPHRADLSLAVSSEPPAVATASTLPPWAPSSASASPQSTANGASIATTGSCNGQEGEVRPSPELGMGEDHTAAPPLPWLPLALPTGGMSISTTTTHPGTEWVSSAVTPEVLWGTQTTGTFPHGDPALLVDVLGEVAGNGSVFLGTVLASFPSAALAHGVTHPQVLDPSLPTAEPVRPAVTLSDPSLSPAQQPMAPTGAHPSPAWTRAVGPSVTGVSTAAAPDATAELGVTKAPHKDGAAVVASPSPPAQGPALHPDPFLTSASADGPSAGQHHEAMTGAEMSALPGAVAGAGHNEPCTASVGSAAAPAGSSEPPSSSPGSKMPTLKHGSDAVHHAGTMFPSPSYPLASTRAVHGVGCQPMPCDAQPVSRHSVVSQQSSTATEHLPAYELMSTGKPGSLAPSHPPRLPSSAHVLPLQFRLLDVTYTEALSSKASESYRRLEEEVMLMLNQTLSVYETFLQAKVLEFMNGSVVVRGQALFRGDAPAPTGSHLIRTMVTEASRGRRSFSWRLEPWSVQSGGFTLENLAPEKLSLSFTVLQSGRSRTDPMEGLISKVTESLGALYHVRNFTITQLRNRGGDLELTGDVYLDTIVHADVLEALQALTALRTSSVDLTSLLLEGARLHLQLYPLSLLITNRRFSKDLLDPLSAEHQELSTGIGDAVARALRDHRSFLQVLIKEFLPGSLICHGDLVFQHPAPSSLEVLEELVLSVGSNKALAGSDFQVDPYSLAVGEDTLEPPLPEPGFPEYGVVIIVVCGLIIITVPVILLLCLKTRRLGQWHMAPLWDRRDPEVGIQTLEMDNQGFWASSEQGAGDAQPHSRSYSA